jgi:soluble lytic murein transglycosylase
LIHDSRLSDALLELRVAERAMPRVRDRIALRRAGVLMRLGRPADACDAYALAEASPDRNVAAEARIGMVRCLLEAGVRSGEGELERIVQRYPRMGDRADLRFALAQARRSWGDTAGAVAIYRSIDLDEPESRVAAGARSALAEIAATGFNVHPYTPNDVVDRAERLVKRGSVESGHEAVEQLLATQNLPQLQAGRTQLLAARIARIEGRWDDVRTAVEMAMTLGVPAAEAQRLLPRGTLPVADADPSTLRADGETQLKHLFVGRPTQKIQTPQLRAALEIAVRYGLKDSATAIVGTLRDRTSVPAAARFEAAMLAFGVASDEAIANLLATVESTAAYRVAARYHHGRALERMGRYGEAEADYLWVLSEDRRDPRYYAMWADLRLWAMRSERAQTCMVDDRGAPDLVTAALEALPQEAPTSMAAETLPPDAASDAHAAPAPGAALAALTSQEPTTAEAAADPEAENNARRARLLPKLSGVAELYGEAYPWLARAADLVALDLFEDAADEVGEAYLAWRDARGDLRLRSGLEAVLTGDAPARHVADNALRKARLSLDADARGALAAVAGELGDPGVSLRFAETRGEMRGEVRPRAYSDDVEHAATKYALDPNLLFAVMRVESIYHRQIVSYAGAVGLMQIMPRTGMLIARKLGVEDFDVSDLLNPRTNVEFAAWYLSSLLKRFDGRLPLAIAAYNGGPHNVRLWMREGNPDMPLDAFLERIPFDQTHRYVRRVLTHYAAYRAQQNLPMTRLDIALPAPQPDTMAF